MLPADTRAVASDVMARIGVVHGLILSLVFASTHSGARKYFWARLAYAPIHAAGVPYPRTLVWAISIRRLLRLLWALF